jgi:hypothetical protein
MIDTTTESLVTLAQAGRLLPPGRNNKTPSLSCILRWVMTGCRAPSGELVKLEACRLGDRWITSREALQRFAERLTPRLENDTPTAHRTPRQRQRAAEQAGRELDAIGI